MTKGGPAMSEDYDGYSFEQALAEAERRGLAPIRGGQEFWDGWFPEVDQGVVGEDPFPGGARVPEPGDFRIDDPGVGLDQIQTEQEFFDRFGGGDNFDRFGGDTFGAGGDPGSQLFYSVGTGDVVDAQGKVIQPAADFQRVVGDIQEAQKWDQRLQPSEWQKAWAAVNESAKPLNDFLGGGLGRTLTSLGLGAIGLGVSQAFAGSERPFVPPGRVPVAANPAAVALSRRIRELNLRGLEDRSKAPGSSADPITNALTDRLDKALRGEVSNPVLERSNRQEKDELFNTLVRRGVRPEAMASDSAAIEKTGRLEESQSIRRYLDNLQTIGQLEPRQAGRLSGELANNASLAGLNDIGAELNYNNELALRLAYNNYLQDQAGKRSLATQIGNIFGTAAGGLSGSGQRFYLGQGY